MWREITDPTRFASRAVRKMCGHSLKSSIVHTLGGESEEEDEREETQVIIVDQESATNVVLDIPEEEEEPEVEQIFDVVEEQASFPGGLQAMMEFLGKNTKYPEMARENGIQGRVYIQFVVYKDGSIKDVKVMKGRHATLDKEAVRVVKSMPKWVPGKQRGKSVNSRFTLPVKFKIQ